MSNPYAGLTEYELRHLPTHLSGAEIWDELERLLTDLFFLEAKTEAGMVLDLADDFTTAVQALPGIRPLRCVLRLLEEALRRDIQFIQRHHKDYPQGLFQCLWNTCSWCDGDETHSPK